jgi:hypothetical protein
VTGLDDFERGQIRSISLRDLSYLPKGSDSLAHYSTSLRITNRRLDFKKAREKFRQEGPDGNIGVNKLRHVIHNSAKAIVNQNERKDFQDSLNDLHCDFTFSCGELLV